MNKKVRKASDVLLSMEASLNEALGYLRNQNMVMTLLLKKVETLENASSAPPTVKPDWNLSAPTAKTQMPGLKPGVRLGKQAESPANTAPGEPELKEEVIKSNIKRVPVQQRVLYPDGKNVCLANVEILQAAKNGEFKIVKTCRTNSAGKWQMGLEPGKYLIHLSKIGTSQKPTVETSYSIDVPVSNVPVELDVYNVEV